MGARSDEVGRSGGAGSARRPRSRAPCRRPGVAVPIESDAPTAMIRLSKAGFASAGDDPCCLW